MSRDRTETIIGEHKQHPVALALMPGGMDEAEFKAFCDDVEQRGIIMPVTMYEGMILDGWHRYRAGKKTGTPFKTIEYTGKDPAGYVCAVNVLRRKLSSLQRALVGVRLHLDHNLTQRDVCKKLGISNEAVNLVLRAVQSGSSKLIKKLEDDSDFTRGMLKEELSDAGLFTKKDPVPVPTGVPNSVFAIGAQHMLDKNAQRIVTHACDTQDTDGIGDDLDEDELLMGKGQKSAARASRKPQATAAQTLSEGFKALMLDEKETFLRMIWPEAGGICSELGLKLMSATVTPIGALTAAVKAEKKTSKVKQTA